MKKESLIPIIWGKSKVLLLIFFLLLCGKPAAQEEMTEEMKRTLEREVKTSGLYHYGEAVDKEKDQALSVALSQLLSGINEEMTDAGSSLTKELISLHAGRVDLPRGNRVRVLVFIKKAELPALLASKGTVAPAEKQESAKPVQEIEMSIEENATLPQANPGAEQSGSLSADQQTLLNEIVHAGSVAEINKLLRENKMKGKLVFGSMNTLTNSATVYILVYKASGEIIALLDRGAGGERMDLVSGGNKPVPDIYKGNLRLWFQLL